jgi:RNA polymerase sigma factor (sigma-70 family)
MSSGTPDFQHADPAPTPGASAPDSIEALFLALESPLLHHALRLLGALAPAEEVVQEAFMKLHQHFETVQEPRRWLYRTVHNLALNHHRHQQRHPTIPLQPERSTHSSPSTTESESAELEWSSSELLPDAAIVHQEDLGIVRLTVAALDPRSRELIQLKFEENLSYKEISHRTGLSTGHVGYLLHHALKSIADELSKNGIVP